MPSLLKQSAKSYRTITPTSSPWLQMQYDIKNYKQHWHNVTHAQAKVDHSAPPLLPSFYLRIQQLAVDANRLKQIARENKELTQKINIINRTTGKVDSHMPEYLSATNFEQRKFEANIIAKHNLNILERLLKTGPQVTPTKELLAEWKRIEHTMTHISRYPLFWKKKKRATRDEMIPDRRWTIRNDSIISDNPDLATKKVTKKNRPRVFLEIATKDEGFLGRLVIELYSDIVPDTAANFLSLCRGDNDMGLTYRGNPFCRIIPGLYCQAGDITHLNGSGGKSIYGDLFGDENFHLSHSGPGVVTMHNTGPNTNNSQFMITFQALTPLNGINVVVGKVVKGLKTLFRIKEFGTPSGKLQQGVYINNCGEIESGNNKASSALPAEGEETIDVNNISHRCNCVYNVAYNSNGC